MSQQPSKLDLHGRLKRHAFEHALITTYNFGARFFEDYALETFKSLQDKGNNSVLLGGSATRTGWRIPDRQQLTEPRSGCWEQHPRCEGAGEALQVGLMRTSWRQD